MRKIYIFFIIIFGFIIFLDSSFIPKIGVNQIDVKTQKPSLQTASFMPEIIEKDAVFMQVASPTAIDLAMTKGVNYPKGLLRWADEIGVSKVCDTIERLHADYLDDRYRPSLLLKKMAAEHGRFF